MGPDDESGFRCAGCERILRTAAERLLGWCDGCEHNLAEPPMEPEDDRG